MYYSPLTLYRFYVQEKKETIFFLRLLRSNQINNKQSSLTLLNQLL